MNETDVVAEDDGRLLVRGRTHQSFLPPKDDAARRGLRGRRGHRASAKADARRGSRLPDRDRPRPRAASKKIDQRRCWMFSGPGKNYHTDAEQARKLGFPRIVVQGMMSTCFAAQVMQDAFGEGWLEGGKLSLKLVNVLWVDEAVVAYAREREREREGTRTRVHCDVWVDKSDGTRVALGTASAVE